MKTSGRIIASTGDIDYTIAARIGARVFDYALQGKVYVHGVILAEWQSKGWRSVYRGETQRKGKAQAGHYTTIVK